MKLGSTPPVFEDGSWAGIWVTGVSLRLTAEPEPGWRFAGWEGGASGTDPALTLTPAGDTNVTAVFERIP